MKTKTKSTRHPNRYVQDIMDTFVACMLVRQDELPDRMLVTLRKVKEMDLIKTKEAKGAHLQLLVRIGRGGKVKDYIDDIDAFMATIN